MGSMPYSYMRSYREQRTAERYEQAVKYLGGKCAKCGKIDKFDFDHIVQGTKSYTITTHLWDFSWERLKLELDKCQLLCIPCHKEKTKQEIGKVVGHGEGKTGKRNCYCSLCKPLKKAYNKKYNRIRYG